MHTFNRSDTAQGSRLRVVLTGLLKNQITAQLKKPS